MKTTKKLLSLLLCAVMLPGGVAVGGSGFVQVLDTMSVKVSAADELKEGICTYTVSGGKATITACDESVSGAVAIPSTLGGYPVTSIGNDAFIWHDSITSVTIPKT